MRNSYEFLKVVAVAFLIAFSPMLVFSQDNGETEVPEASSSFSPFWLLNAHLGFNQFYGDLNEYDYFQNPAQWRFAGGIYFGRQFSPLLGLRGQLLYAGVSAESEDLNMYMKGDLFEYNLNATLSFIHLFSRYNPDRKFDLYGFAGIGQFHYKSNSYDLTTDAPLGVGYYPRVGYFGKGIGKRGLFMAIPYGLGISYSIAEKWDLTFESSLRYTGADELDSYVSDKYDQYGPTTVGITYRMYGGVDLNKMARDFNTITFTTVPEVLEMHGDSVRVTITGKVPENYFHKKAAIHFTPVLTYEGGETRLKSINLLGEDVVGDGTTINMKEGGTFTYTDVFAYKPEMAVSELMVTPLIYEPKAPVPAGITEDEIRVLYRNVEAPQVKLVDGIIVTSTRIVHDEVTIMADHAYEKEVIISQDAIIYFEVNRHNLNWNLPLNKAENARQDVNELEEFLRQGWRIRDIDINAWASPEGEESFNQGLSERRAQTGLKYTHDMLRKLVREKNSTLAIENVENDIKYNVNARGEDWDGFMKAVQASDIPDKNVIINVVNSQADVKKREQEIRNMTIVYEEIEEHILPPLRRVAINVNTYEPKKTDEQIAELATTDPAQLDEKELLFAATLTDDQDVQLNIFRSAINQFPDSYKGYNNAAAIELERGNEDKAAEYLQKANELGAGKAEVLNNMGVLESKRKEFTKAETHYADARRLGANVDQNLGIVMINKGDYSRALTYFGDKTCNHNVALAQLLSGNIAGANQNAKCAPEKAETSYLLAVIAARTNDTQSMISNLSKAISLDPALKDVARNDREFLKFFENPEFKALVQ
jgi:tetratricopeptide (TPR) repeat protein